MIAAAFKPFLEQTPLCVMTRVTLESLFQPERLDTLFRDTAQKQYEKELLFSQVVELMLAVVLRVDASVHAAYPEALWPTCCPSATRLSTTSSAAWNCLSRPRLVADSAARVGPVASTRPGRPLGTVVARLSRQGARRESLVRDRASPAGASVRPGRRAPPGTVLAVYEQERDLVTQVFLTPDGHAQERSLLDAVLQSVRDRDLWIADRNFCTPGISLPGWRRAGATFVIRQHGNLPGRLLGKRRARGRTDTGRVYEQAMALTYAGETLQVRRVTVVLDKPTRDGDPEIHIVTNSAARAIPPGRRLCSRRVVPQALDDREPLL